MNIYQSPLSTRYASTSMRQLFSDDNKFQVWRRLWIVIAKAQQELGLDISDEAIKQMEVACTSVDLIRATEYEKKFKHDVMAHIHTFGDAAPAAKGIIHLGATSQDIVDNADLIIIKDALNIIRGYLITIIAKLSNLADQNRAIPCLGFTHFQPAQLTTVGKRMCMWCESFVRDLKEIDHKLNNLEFRGLKGATGTQASYLELFDGDHQKIKEMECKIATHFGFNSTSLITGQTYNRKIDVEIANILANIAISTHKICNDIRLLSNSMEIEEPFADTQIGSSAMAYKRNPMKCERATGLTRFLINLTRNAIDTASEQWLERTLDDSSNRRMYVPEMFLTADAMLSLIVAIINGLNINYVIIKAHVNEKLPFIATENILMNAVKSGEDRQEIHEVIRKHSMEAVREIRNGKPNDLLSRLQMDPKFPYMNINEDLDANKYIGRATEQVDEFVLHVSPIIAEYNRSNLKACEEINI